MVDHSCDEETERQIYDRVMQNKEVAGIDSLHTRIFDNKIYVDIENANTLKNRTAFVTHSLHTPFPDTSRQSVQGGTADLRL